MLYLKPIYRYYSPLFISTKINTISFCVTSLYLKMVKKKKKKKKKKRKEKNPKFVLTITLK